VLTTANQEMADIDTVAGGTERSATTLELFFDLAYVFAITQVVALVHHEPTVVGMLRSREERTAEQATGSESAS